MKASKVGPNTRILIDRVITKFSYPVQSFRSCFGILRFAERYSPKALEQCCHDAVLAGKCNYTYISNTIATYYTESAIAQAHTESTPSDTVHGVYKDDDAKYSLNYLLKRQEREVRHEI